MAQFVDANGQQWELVVTVTSVKRVRELLGVDLGNMFSGDPPLLTRLDMDIVLLFDVIFALVKPQADSRGVSDEEFVALLPGEASVAARDAFWKAVLDFFLQFRRPDVVAAIRKQTAITNETINRLAARMETLSVEDTAEKAMKAANQTLDQSFGKPSTAGQAY